MANDSTNDSNWSSGFPTAPGMSDQPAGQGAGNSWDLGQLIPNVLQGQLGQSAATQANPLPGNQFQGNQIPNFPNNFQQQNYPPANYPQIGSSGDPTSILPPAGNFAPPAGNGFSGSYDDSYGTQSAQQPDYTLPR